MLWHPRAAVRCSSRSQVRLDGLHCDGRGCAGAEATRLDDDGDGDLGVAGRREAGEDGVVEAGVVGAVLRCSGRPGDHDAGGRGPRGRVGGAGRVLGHLGHHGALRREATRELITCRSTAGRACRITAWPGARTWEIRYGRSSVPLLAMAAASMASCSGVTVSLNWPMAESAVCAGSVSSG